MSRTRPPPMARRMPGASTFQGRFVASTLPSRTGPAIPNAPAAMGVSASLERKSAMTSSSPVYLVLGKDDSRTRESPSPPSSAYRAKLVLVPPISPARTWVVMTALKSKCVLQPACRCWTRLLFLSCRLVSCKDNPLNGLGRDASCLWRLDVPAELEAHGR